MLPAAQPLPQANPQVNPYTPFWHPTGWNGATGAVRSPAAPAAADAELGVQHGKVETVAERT